MPKRLTMQRFQAVAMRIANQMFVRVYYALNWPQKPQVLGIWTKPPISSPVLSKELLDLGFEYKALDQIWVIEREEEVPMTAEQGSVDIQLVRSGDQGGAA